MLGLVRGIRENLLSRSMPRAPTLVSMRITEVIRSSKRSPLLQVAKSAIATAAAWVVAGLLIPGPPPIFAAIAALLVVQPSLNQSLSKAIERSVGVVTGVVIASLLGLAFGGASWVIVLSVVCALFIAWALRMTPGTSNQVAISALLVLALGAASQNYALDRILETVIGAVIGIIVNMLIVPPVAVAPARVSVDAFGEELAASLERLARALQNIQTAPQLQGLLIEARLLRPMRDAADTAIAAGAESLTLNPRGRRHRQELGAMQAQLELLGPIVVQVIGMTRALVDRYDPSLAGEPAMRAIAEQLRRAAHDVRLVLRRGRDPHPAPVVRGDEPDAQGVYRGAEASTVAALTAPLMIAAPSAEHWILIGSLLEDLHRIHEGLQEGLREPR